MAQSVERISFDPYNQEVNRLRDFDFFIVQLAERAVERRIARLKVLDALCGAVIAAAGGVLVVASAIADPAKFPWVTLPLELAAMIVGAISIFAFGGKDAYSNFPVLDRTVVDLVNAPSQTLADMIVELSDRSEHSSGAASRKYFGLLAALVLFVAGIVAMAWSWISQMLAHVGR